MSNYSHPVTKDYIKFALCILKDCGVQITDQIKKHIQSLPTEEAVDNFKIKLLRDSLGVK